MPIVQNFNLKKNVLIYLTFKGIEFESVFYLLLFLNIYLKNYEIV